MEDTRAVEHDRRGEEKEGPLNAGRVSCPQRPHPPHAGRVHVWYEAHIHHADDESGDGDYDGERKTPQQRALFASLHVPCTFFKGRRVIDGGGKRMS